MSTDQDQLSTMPGQEKMTLSLGDLLRGRRRHLKLSDRDVATAAGVDPGTLSRVERGKVAATLGTTVRVAKAVHIAPRDLGRALVDGAPLPGGALPVGALPVGALPGDASVDPDRDKALAVTLGDLDAIATRARSDPSAVDRWLRACLAEIAARANASARERGANDGGTGDEGAGGVAMSAPDATDGAGPLAAATAYRITILYPPLTDEDVLAIYRAGGAITPADVFAYLRGLERGRNVRWRGRHPAVARVLENGRLESLKFVDALDLSRALDQKANDPYEILSLCWAAILYQVAYDPREGGDVWEALLPSADASADVEERGRYAGRLVMGAARWLGHLHPGPGDRAWLDEIRALAGPRPARA